MNFSSTFSFCPHCGTPLRETAAGNVVRRKCDSCQWVHYRNPTVGVAVILVENGQLLLGRRRDGGFCIPCGHVEWDEPIEEAAHREFEEETGLRVELEGVFSVQSNFHNEHQQTVGVWYLGRSVSGELRAGGDLTEVGFFPLNKMPSLKFPTDVNVVNLLQSKVRHDGSDGRDAKKRCE